MQTLKDWILGALICVVFLAVCSIDDGSEDKQQAADDLKVAQNHERSEADQAKRELKARAAYAGHMLALERVK